MGAKREELMGREWGNGEIIFSTFFFLPGNKNKMAKEGETSQRTGAAEAHV